MKSKGIIQIEIKNFFRARVAFLGLVILLLGGFAGMYFGKNFIDKQVKVIAMSSVIQEETQVTNVKKFGADLGDFLYTHPFTTAHLPSPWASFATGQRDVHGFVLPIRMLALEGQMYDTDLVNPISQLLGNLDISFILLLVFPLIIIAFSYNAWSYEQESGVWKLVNIQSQKSTLSILMGKLWIRFLVVYLIAIFLLIMSGFYMRLPFDQTFLAVWLTISGYLFFWFAVVSFVISLNRSSNFNAVSLLAVWIVLSIFLPAILNVLLTKTLPVPEALSTVVQQRESYHEKWDKPKEVTMEKFYSHYPEMKKYHLPSDKFTWGWYYAMQQMGDDESEIKADELLKKLQMRQNWTNKVAFVIPSINAQLQLNRLAHTDLQSHIHYLDALKAYHEKIRLYFYPLIFTDGKITQVDFKQIPPLMYQDSGQVAMHVWGRILISYGMSLLLFIFSYFNFKKNTRQFQRN